MSTLIDAVKMAEKRRELGARDLGVNDLPPEGYLATSDEPVSKPFPALIVGAFALVLFVVILVVKVFWVDRSPVDQPLEQQVSVSYVYANVISEAQWSKISLISTLPSEQLKRLPNLRFQAQAYYGSSEQDFVIINGTRYQAGDLISGLTLTQITEWGIVLSFGNQQYRLPANTNFIHRSK